MHCRDRRGGRLEGGRQRRRKRCVTLDHRSHLGGVELLDARSHTERRHGLLELCDHEGACGLDAIANGHGALEAPLADGVRALEAHLACIGYGRCAYGQDAVSCRNADGLGAFNGRTDDGLDTLDGLHAQ